MGGVFLGFTTLHVIWWGSKLDTIHSGLLAACFLQLTECSAYSMPNVRRCWNFERYVEEEESYPQIYINWYAYRIVFHTNIYTHISFDVFHASCPRIGCWDNLQETLILYLQNRGPPVCTRTLDVWVTTENAQLREEVEMFFCLHLLLISS